MPRPKRRVSAIAAELLNPIGVYFLSFANSKKFLGAAIVKARGELTAEKRAKTLGIHPGGEVIATRIPAKNVHRVPADMYDRAINEKELDERLDGKGINE